MITLIFVNFDKAKYYHRSWLDRDLSRCVSRRPTLHCLLGDIHSIL